MSVKEQSDVKSVDIWMESARGGRGKETNGLHGYSADQSILNNHIYDVDNGAVQTLFGPVLGLDRVRVLWKTQPVAAMMDRQLQQ